MKKFIAYFDYLGFKDFILNNDIDYQDRIMNNIWRDIETALSQENFKIGTHGAIADLTKNKIHTINFSDTVVFWTADDSLESLEEILNTTFIFNWNCVDYFFPVRGTLTYGELQHAAYNETSSEGGSYSINSVYGKGLISAYLRAESLNWAGAVIDESVIDEIRNRNLNVNDILLKYAKIYNVPYKNRTSTEYAFRIVKGSLDNNSYQNFRDGIIDNFSKHNKSMNHPGVQEKLDNTISYLASFIEN